MDESLRILGIDQSDCLRLPALHYMLRKAQKFRNTYGSRPCSQMAALAATISIVGVPGGVWPDLLAKQPAIDPGEAMLFAWAAETGGFILTGDKKAVCEVKRVQGLPQALAGRIITFEAMMIELCRCLGQQKVREKIAGFKSSDGVLRNCFADRDGDALACLASYDSALRRSASPLLLWRQDCEA